MRPYKEGDRWVIATNFRNIGGDGIIRLEYERWTGERWSVQGSPLAFTTGEEAQRYIDENRAHLEANGPVA